MRALARTALAAAALVAGGCGPSAAPARAPAATDTVAFTLPNDRGDLIDVPLASGKVVVIDAWGPTCAPCREKVPALVAKAAELEAAGAQLVLVAVLADGEDTEAARATLASWGVTRDFLVDRGGVLRREAGVAALPATLVLAPSGEVRWVAPSDAAADDVVAAAARAR